MHRIPRIAVLTVLALLLAGCAAGDRDGGSTSGVDQMTEPVASPTATPPGPAAAEADVASAKQAYVDYAAAISALDLADPASLDLLLSHTTGEQRDYDEKFYGQLFGKGWSREGAVRVTTLEAAAPATSDSISLATCLDVSALHFYDENGVENKPSRGAEMVAATATLVEQADGRWLVSSIEGRSGAPLC